MSDSSKFGISELWPEFPENRVQSATVIVRASNYFTRN